MAKNEGGRAFPNDGAWANGHPEGGMSLRDYFAAQALPQLVRYYGAGNVNHPGATALATAGAYMVADAMLLEREKE